VKPDWFEVREVAVPASVLYMSMSLDGDIDDPNDEPGAIQIRYCVPPMSRDDSVAGPVSH
jgi:hypothetical protein